MGTINSIFIFILFGCYFFQIIRCSPIGTSVINCVDGSDARVGTVDEGYNGPVEELTGIPLDINVKLVDHRFPDHLQFLELRFTPGSSTATVTTKKNLDADALKSTSGILYYSIMCVGTNFNNTRTLQINDLNDNPPVFTSDTYNKTISEALPVGSTVVKVEAEDADATPANNRVHYFIMAPVPNEFEIRNDGSILLKQRLNYNMANVHSFTVEARDEGEFSDTALVTITVEDFDNMNPYFTHNLYTAVIREEQMGPFHTILPEAIEAKDGDTGINQPIVYSISTVSPSKYSSHFNIRATSGIITVVTQLDREEVDMVTLTIKAAQNDDSLKTADATVSVKIEDVNDNPPEFDKSSYSATILENSPTDSFILRPTITDRDEGGFKGTLHIIPDSVPFSITPDGILQVKNSSALDREKIPSFTFQIEARENAAPNQVVWADVTITLLDENDNSPQFGSSTYEGKIFKNQTVDMVVTKVEAVDPDEGVNGEVKYAIEGGNQDSHFSIDETTGEIHLRKLVVLEENKVLRFLLTVTAKDGGQVSQVSLAQVDILAIQESSAAVVISLNRPATIVEMMVTQMEESLERALGWTVEVINIMSAKSFCNGDRLSRENVKTYVTFIAMDNSSTVVPSEQVESKLETEREAVKVQLETVFGEGVDYVVEDSPGTEDSSKQEVIIAVSVVVPLIVVGSLVLYISKKRETLFQGARRKSKDNVMANL